MKTKLAFSPDGFIIPWQTLKVRLIMNENLHTPDSFIVPSTNLLKVKNHYIRSLHIPDSFIIGQQLRKVDLSSIYFCQEWVEMNNNLDE
jgi:hypothetical protein